MLNLKDYNERELAKELKVVEKNFETYLDPNLTHFIRCDGRGFSKFCRGFKTPFDNIFRNTMERTMVEMCKTVQGAILGFTQSDEITIMFRKENEKSDLPFGGRVQKICSEYAGEVQNIFNKIFANEVEIAKIIRMKELIDTNEYDYDEIMKIVEKEFAIYYKKFYLAKFDCRVFSLPREESRNVFIWRQLDCYKNAIQMVARHFYSHKELDKKKQYEMIKMISQKGVSIEDYPPQRMYGVAAKKEMVKLYEGTERECIRNRFVPRPANEIILNENETIF